MFLLSICSQTHSIVATISDSLGLDKTPCFKPNLRISTSLSVSSNLVKFVITLFGFFLIPSVILFFTIKASCFYWCRADVTVFIFDCALLIKYIINLYLIHVVACFNLVLLVSCSADNFLMSLFLSLIALFKFFRYKLFFICNGLCLTLRHLTKFGKHVCVFTSI